MSGVGGSARIRQRKVSLKNSIRVVYEKDLKDAAGVDFSKDPLRIETGVEKHEEQEFHLQEILNQAIAPVKKVYIPTPNASAHWSEYKKYYEPKSFESKSYIRQSATVEDCSGCPYNMDEEDEEFLTKFNESSDEKCSEDELEMICYLFDTVVSEKQPFLSTEPNQLLDYPDLESAVLAKLSSEQRDANSLDRLLGQLNNSVFTPKWKPSPNRSETASIKLFGPEIYKHYRARKIARKGGPLSPQLKFETNSQKDDHDPYVCFRRREQRHTRKTRRTDQQSNERLRRLQAEMRQAKLLFELVAKREQLRLQALQADYDVFEGQCSLKAAKRKAKVAGDDEDLLTALVKRREEPRKLPTKRAPEPKVERVEKAEAAKPEKVEKKSQVKVPSSKIPDLDHITLEQMLAEREEAIQTMLNTKLKAREAADHGWVSKTDDAFVPWVNCIDSSETNTPDDLYSSLNSLYPPPAKRICLPLSHSLGRKLSQKFIEPQVIWAGTDNDDEGFTVRRKITDSDIAPSDKINAPRNSSIALRKRTGRSGMQFIDRRSVIRSCPLDESDVANQRFADRFKFDCESQTELPVDIYGDPARLNGVQRPTQQIRFGSMLLAKSYEYLHEAQQQRQIRLKRKQEGQPQSTASGQASSSGSTSQAGQSTQAQGQSASHQSQSQSSSQSQSQSQGQDQGQSNTTPGRQPYPISVVSF